MPESWNDTKKKAGTHIIPNSDASDEIGWKNCEHFVERRLPQNYTMEQFMLELSKFRTREWFKRHALVHPSPEPPEKELPPPTAATSSEPPEKELSPSSSSSAVTAGDIIIKRIHLSNNDLRREEVPNVLRTGLDVSLSEYRMLSVVRLAPSNVQAELYETKSKQSNDMRDWALKLITGSDRHDMYLFCGRCIADVERNANHYLSLFFNQE
jgi:hypothetical protein